MSDLFSARHKFSALVWIACVAVLFNFGCKKKSAPPPPPEVFVITAEATNVPIFEEWIGTLDGLVNAQIRAQVSGYLLSQNYREGSEVKKGDWLFQIDPRPFQAMVDQAKARLAQDQAQQQKTEADVTRYTPLAKEQAISQEELDNAIHSSAAAQAQVKSDNAAIENAELNLSFTKITSPIEGIAGIALAQIGDLVGPSSALLTTVSTINPMKVYFQVSEQSYLDFWHKFATTNAGEALELELILSDNSIYPEKGKVLFMDRQINQNTGTLQIAGEFPNPSLILRPGQYGKVRALTQTRTNVILLPQRAVTQLQGMYQVRVVDNQHKAHVQPVSVGEQIGSDWIIEKGLQPRASVIVEGLSKANEGVVVNPKPFSAGTNQPPS